MTRESQKVGIKLLWSFAVNEPEPVQLRGQLPGGASGADSPSAVDCTYLKVTQMEEVVSLVTGKPGLPERGHQNASPHAHRHDLL